MEQIDAGIDAIMEKYGRSNKINTELLYIIY
jgi:hypothetical protein